MCLMIITIYYKMLRATVMLMGWMIFKQNKTAVGKSQTVTVSIKAIKWKDVPWSIIQVDDTYTISFYAIYDSIKLQLLKSWTYKQYQANITHEL